MKFLILFIALVSLAQAGLEWEQKRLDLPLKDPKTKGEAVFHFTNTGSTPVRIKSVKAGCHCTAAVSNKDLYAPGEKGEITAAYDPTGQQGGYQPKGIAVVTDESEEPVVLIVDAVIPQYAQVEPLIVSWTTGEVSQPKPMRVTFREGTEFNLLSVQTPNASYSASFKVIEPGHIYEISITPPKNLDAGVDTYVTIVTDQALDETDQQVIIHGYARIIPRFTAGLLKSTGPALFADIFGAHSLHPTPFHREKFRNFSELISEAVIGRRASM